MLKMHSAFRLCYQRVTGGDMPGERNVDAS